MAGNFVNEKSMFIIPTFKVPIADKINLHVSEQGRQCGMFETHFFKCMEAFGARMGRIQCDLERRDYRECVSRDKQMKRVRAMRREHWMQYLRGERSTPFEDHIRIGEYHPDYYEHVLHG